MTEREYKEINSAIERMMFAGKELKDVPFEATLAVAGAFMGFKMWFEEFYHINKTV